jgi:hypothetical protein
MANEIKVAVSLSVTKSNNTASGSISTSQTLAGNNFGQNVATAPLSGASAEILPVGELTTFGGWFYIKNVEATNTTVNLNIYQDGATGSVLIGTIANGEAFLFKPAAALGIKGSHASLTADYAVVYCEP